MLKKEKIYDCTFTNCEYLKENDTREINLEYYLLSNEQTDLFGIEVLKRERDTFGLENIETEIVQDYNEDINQTKKIIGILGENKVTPIALSEVLQEI